MNAKQKIHRATLNKWAARIHDQKESGLIVDKWYKREGVTKHAHNYWKRLIKEDVLESVDIPDIVPILPPVAVPSPLSATSPANPSCESHNPIPASNVAVTLGDIRIEIDPNVSSDFIANIIKAVRYA